MGRNEKNGIIAIDIGSSKIAALMFTADLAGNPIVEGFGVVASEGVKKGMITDVEAAAAAISAAVTKAEDKSGMLAGQAVVGIGGKHIGSQRSNGMIPLEKGPRRITQEDLDKVIGYAGVVRLPEDSSLLGIVPRDIIVDGQRGIDRPIGMGAVRLEVDAIVLTAGTSQLEACEAAIHPLRTELAGKYANAICSAEAVLTSEEKEWGAAVVDIGAGTTDVAIYTEKALIRLGIIPIGSSNITRDIAQVLQVPVNHAENLKIKFGTARPAMVDKDEIIDSASMAVGADASLGSAISRCELCRVIEARVYEIVEQVALMLEQEGLLGRLPSGIVLTGGGSLMPYLPEYIQENLKVPARLARPSATLSLPKEIDYPQMSAVAGLVRTCLMDQRSGGDSSNQKREKSPGRGMKNLLKGLIDLN